MYSAGHYRSDIGSTRKPTNSTSSTLIKNLPTAQPNSRSITYQESIRVSSRQPQRQPISYDNPFIKEKMVVYTPPSRVHESVNTFIHDTTAVDGSLCRFMGILGLETLDQLWYVCRVKMARR
jgi:hypothetical protein